MHASFFFYIKIFDKDKREINKNLPRKREVNDDDQKIIHTNELYNHEEI